MSLYSEKLMVVIIILLLGIVTPCLASDFFEEKLVVVKCKLNEDKTNAVLDLPFRVFHQEVVANGVKYGPYPLPKSHDGKEVWALITYAKQDIEFMTKLVRWSRR